MPTRIPNPNDGRDLFELNQSLKAWPTKGPLLPTTINGDLGIGLMSRGMANRRTGNYEDSQASIKRGIGTINTVAPNPQFEGFKQALFESGANRLQTGGARRSFGDAPGFFDTQATPLSGMRMSPNEQALYQELLASGARRRAPAGVVRGR